MSIEIMTEPSKPEQERVTLARKIKGQSGHVYSRPGPWFILHGTGVGPEDCYEVRTFTPESSTPGEERLPDVTLSYSEWRTFTEYRAMHDIHKREREKAAQREGRLREALVEAADDLELEAKWPKLATLDDALDLMAAVAKDLRQALASTPEGEGERDGADNWEPYCTCPDENTIRGDCPTHGRRADHE